MTDPGKTPRKPQSLLRLLICAVAPVVVVFGVLMLVPDAPARHEGLVRGPEFQAVSTVESAEVWSGLLHHLESLGFQPDAHEAAPEPVSGAGEEERQALYSRTIPDRGTLQVLAILSASTIHTRVEWEARTRIGNPRLTDIEAARTALGIDDFFRARMETNLVPPDERDSRTEELRRKGKQSTR